MAGSVAALSAVVCVGGVAILVASIRSLLRLLAGAVLNRLPLVAEQEVRFDGAGEVVLHLEGPRFARLMALPWALAGGGSPRFEMHDPGMGREVPSRRSVARARVDSFRRSRIALCSFAVDHAGPFQLIVRQLPGDVDAGKYGLVLTRPHTGAMVMRILAIVLAGMLTIGGLVGVILGLVSL